MWHLPRLPYIYVSAPWFFAPSLLSLAPPIHAPTQIEGFLALESWPIRTPGCSRKEPRQSPPALAALFSLTLARERLSSASSLDVTWTRRIRVVGPKSGVVARCRSLGWNVLFSMTCFKNRNLHQSFPWKLWIRGQRFQYRQFYVTERLEPCRENPQPPFSYFVRQKVPG